MKKKINLINTEHITNVSKSSKEIGDSCHKSYSENKKIENAKVAISAYRNVLYANSLLIKIDNLK